MKKAYLSTLGCKVNQFETAAFKSQLEQQGVVVTSDLEEADYIIVNTCTVTAKAGGESRREVRKALRRNDRAKVLVTGCHAQLEHDELIRLPDIDSSRLVIAGNDAKERIITNLLAGHSETDSRPRVEIRQVQEIASLQVDRFAGRTRAYLRVQDGCESFCSYCIVPYARGRSRSLPLAEVMRQAFIYEQAGHHEIVVTGIHVGRYGHDLSEKCNIVGLLDRLCQEFSSIRFRLSSIEPLEIGPELLNLMIQAENLMPHLHIPLQSGDNEVLKRMNRRYTREQFREVIDKCRAAVPDAAIGFDVMVGFPGETDSMFEQSRELIESSECTYLHVFPFSKRPGTRAAEFEDQVTTDAKQKRVEILRTLGREKSSAFYRRYINSRRDALLETEKLSGSALKGYTDNYIPVVTALPRELPTEPVVVELIELSGEAVKARIV
ncbi:MAG: tRNA (N(6)-L-threonylcarbamoyladenosine(37)-C(2))-methylthiotransferase MtaB [Desulfofustis sp.]|nr:tRNA (N(6)-L-threonylcarbamoyladenosine(37)-C(2))-methylthiotransferase MtaB [Desulfofustis sp.]